MFPLYVLFFCNSKVILARCTWLLQLMTKPARADTMPAEMHLRFRKDTPTWQHKFNARKYTGSHAGRRLNWFSKCCT